MSIFKALVSMCAYRLAAWLVQLARATQQDTKAIINIYHVLNENGHEDAEAKSR